MVVSYIYRNIDFYTEAFNNVILDFISTCNHCTGVNKNAIDTMPVPLQDLLLEISRFFNIYYLQSNSYPIDEILLIGKGYELSYLKDIIKEYLNLRVITVQELNNTIVNYFSAIGFALRG